jgi:hypothetical protein
MLKWKSPNLWKVEKFQFKFRKITFKPQKAQNCRHHFGTFIKNWIKLILNFVFTLWNVSKCSQHYITEFKKATLLKQNSVYYDYLYESSNKKWRNISTSSLKISPLLLPAGRPVEDVHPPLPVHPSATSGRDAKNLGIISLIKRFFLRLSLRSKWARAGNTEGGSIIVLLTSC